LSTPREADCTTLEQVILRRINDPTEFPAINHIRLTKAYRGIGEGELTVTAGSLNPQKHVHGGCLYSLADTVCGAAAASNGYLCVTLSSSINFLRPEYFAWRIL
jgi:acyl-CoA thioesterase